MRSVNYPVDVATSEKEVHADPAGGQRDLVGEIHHGYLRVKKVRGYYGRPSWEMAGLK